VTKTTTTAPLRGLRTPKKDLKALLLPTEEQREDTTEPQEALLPLPVVRLQVDIVKLGAHRTTEAKMMDRTHQLRELARTWPRWLVAERVPTVSRDRKTVEAVAAAAGAARVRTATKAVTTWAMAETATTKLDFVPHAHARQLASGTLALRSSAEPSPALDVPFLSAKTSIRPSKSHSVTR
jgi:hypothetical protein